MEFKVSSEGPTTIVHLHGRIVEGPSVDQLQKELSRLVRENKLQTVVDLSEVSWFDSLGIGLLVSHYVSVSSRGGKVLLLGANDKIRSLIEIARLSDRFGWASSIDEANEWFQMSSS